MDLLQQFLDSASHSNQGRRKIGWRYSQEQKMLASQHCHARRDAGWSYSEIAEELGISPITLSRWVQSPPAPDGGVRQSASIQNGFKPVEVVEAAADSSVPSLAVVMPSGLRIEGLQWPQVLELAEAHR